MKVRWYLPVLLTLSIAAAAAVIGWGTWQDAEQADVAAAASVEHAREERRLPVVEVAPAPLPTGVPLVGPEGKTPDGYPLAHVDGAGLRSLMWHDRWDDLDRHFAQFQDAFEADPKFENWPIDAAHAFESAEPSLTRKLDQWVAARPRSWTARLARGMHWLATGWASRGGKVARDTPASDMEAMQRSFERALYDLEAALGQRPKLVAASRGRILALSGAGKRNEMRAEVERALALCPACLHIRVTYLLNTTPRWGGSYEAMLAFAKTCDAALDPRCRVIEGFVAHDQADAADRAKRYDEAEETIGRALALGEHWLFLEKRSEIRRHKNDVAGALADAERALELRPGWNELLFTKAWALYDAKRWEQAGQALLAGLRVDPTDTDAKRIAPHVVHALVVDGRKQHDAGHRDDALRLLDLAAELAPSDRRVLSQRAWVILGSENPDIPALEAAVRNAPDDLRLHQQLDYALAREGQYDRVVAMWTAYLARHPDDGRAHLERGGAFYHLGRRDEMRSDAARACERGITEGCVHAR